MKIRILLLIGAIVLSGCLAQPMSVTDTTELQAQAPMAQDLALPMAMAPAPDMHAHHKVTHRMAEREAEEGDFVSTGRKLLWWNSWNSWGSGRSCWSWWQRCDNQRCQCTEIINNNNNNGRKLLGERLPSLSCCSCQGRE
jgi:hypothetical protein